MDISSSTVPSSPSLTAKPPSPSIYNPLDPPLGGGIVQLLSLDVSIEQHFAGCSERLLSVIQVASAVTSHYCGMLTLPAVD